MEPLPTAANRNDLAEVRRILESKKFTQNDLDLALARAVLNFNQRRAIAELLVAHGANPNGQYGSNYGPIVLATAECIDPDGLQFLIDHGADVTFRPIDSKYGLTSPMISILGTYARGQNDRKHRYIDILLKHNAPVPADITPVMLVIHRGDVAALDKLIDDGSILAMTFPDMPGGNLILRGAGLIHLAVEMGEIACVDLLIARGASINLKSQVIDGFGGQTPIFHAIATNMYAGLPMLEHLVDRYGKSIDMSVRAALKFSDGSTIPTVTPMEYVRMSMKDDAPDWRRSSPKELELLDKISAS